MHDKLEDIKSQLAELMQVAEDLVNKVNKLYNKYESYISEHEDIDEGDITEKIEHLETALDAVESDAARQMIQEEISKLEVQISDAEDFEEAKEELKDLFADFANVFSGLVF